MFTREKFLRIISTHEPAVKDAIIGALVAGVKWTEIVEGLLADAANLLGTAGTLAASNASEPSAAAGTPGVIQPAVASVAPAGMVPASAFPATAARAGVPATAAK